MATVTLDLSTGSASRGPDPRTLLPRRVRLTRGAVERLACLAGTRLPWARPESPTTAAAERTDGIEPADAELRGLGLVADGGALFPEIPPALARFDAPEVLVDLDVSVTRGATPHPTRHAQVRSWQRLGAGGVTSLSTAGGLMELAWYAEHLWPGELARIVTPAPTGTDIACLAPHPGPPIEVPHELLLGSGAALRLGRPDLFAELLRRHPGHDAELLRLLHVGCCARMRAVVSGVGSGGARKIGWLSWVRYVDGWRALTPYLHSGPGSRPSRTPMVRVHPVTPSDLGVAVARVVWQVRA